jgi:fused signal recognition particle receptor
VLDATTGQNGLDQARAFSASAGVTALLLAKLDHSARGGVAVAARRQLGLPIAFVGTGEGPDDLDRFEPAPFVDALLR